jgi:hypothetical protein
MAGWRLASQTGGCVRQKAVQLLWLDCAKKEKAQALAELRAAQNGMQVLQKDGKWMQKYVLCKMPQALCGILHVLKTKIGNAPIPAQKRRKLL